MHLRNHFFYTYSYFQVSFSPFNFSLKRDIGQSNLTFGFSQSARMVWPPERTFSCDKNGKEIVYHVPRARQYVRCDNRSQFIVLIQSHKHDAALPIVKLGKILYERYENAEIFYFSNKKVKIVTPNIDTANNIATDDELNKKFLVIIPQDHCEVKGVCPIPLDYLEHDIFSNANPYNMSHYGDVPDTCKIKEVRRFQRKAHNSNLKIDINLVSICFSGNVLPSHISLDGVKYPLKPYREPVLQCKKCWHYNHSDKACSRPHAICEICGLAHDSATCQNKFFCINCKGPHPASCKDCPIYQRFLSEKIIKADKMKPKPINLFNPTVSYAGSLSLDPINFPALGTQSHSRNPNHNRFPTKKSQNKRARVDDPASISAPATTHAPAVTTLALNTSVLQTPPQNNHVNKIRSNSDPIIEKNLVLDPNTEMLQEELSPNKISVGAEEIVSTLPAQNSTSNLISFDSTPNKITFKPHNTPDNLTFDKKNENSTLQRHQRTK